MTDPTTIPAIWPPDNPLLLLDAAGAGALVVAFVDEGWALDKVVVNRGGMVVKEGRVTPTQRPVAFEPMQQLSVAFGELDAQNEQSAGKFVLKPQLSGSFCSPEIQSPLNESAGRAQTVKSALIWSRKLLLGLLHSLGFVAMSSSLVADSAC